MIFGPALRRIELCVPADRDRRCSRATTFRESSGIAQPSNSAYTFWAIDTDARGNDGWAKNRIGDDWGSVVWGSVVMK